MAFIPVALAAVTTAVESAAAYVGLTSATAAASTGAAAAAGLEVASIPLAAAASASAIPTWLTIGSTVLSAASALSSASAQSSAANYNAAANELQAKQQNDQAAYQAGQEAKKTRLRLAAQRAGAAQGGLDLTGSVLDIMDETAAQGGLNYLTAVYNGDVNATSLRNDAKLNRARGSDATMAGYVNAGSSILTGISDIYKRKGNALSIGAP